MSGLIAVIYFLLTLSFNLLLFALWLHLILRYLRVSALHPIHQVVIKFINPLLTLIEPLAFFTKSLKWGHEWACFILLIGLECVKFIAIGLLFTRGFFHVSHLLLFVLADLIIQPCNLLFYMVLIRVIMSWVNPLWQHPANDIIRLVTDPLLQWGRHIVPDISGFDFSPFIVLIILKVISLFMSGALPL